VIVIADAGPLIYLSEVGLLHLLRDLYAGVLVPRTVYEEVVVHGHGLAGAAEVASASWIQVSDRPLASPLRLGLLTELDAGEAAAIALAVEVRADLILLDERKGRKVARRLGLPVRGTLGVLVEAKKRGHLALVRPILDQLTAAEFRVSDAVKDEILRSAGE
jgi:predicted nucleic acid-binding protein